MYDSARVVDGTFVDNSAGVGDDARTKITVNVGPAAISVGNCDGAFVDNSAGVVDGAFVDNSAGVVDGNYYSRTYRYRNSVWNDNIINWQRNAIIPG